VTQPTIEKEQRPDDETTLLHVVHCESELTSDDGSHLVDG
jgi:hypothetical protein